MRMRFVPTKVHAMIDHVVGPTLMLAPEIFGLHANAGDSIPPRVTGGLQAFYSNLTDYELALKRVLPVEAHLALDGLSGTFLAVAPWGLGNAKRGIRHWLPHAIVGAMEVGLALTTKTEPGDRHQVDHRAKLAAKGARRLLAKVA
jgi:hypothetical protein